MWHCWMKSCDVSTKGINLTHHIGLTAIEEEYWRLFSQLWAGLYAVSYGMSSSQLHKKNSHSSWQGTVVPSLLINTLTERLTWSIPKCILWTFSKVPVICSQCSAINQFSVILRAVILFHLKGCHHLSHLKGCHLLGHLRDCYLLSILTAIISIRLK